MKRKTASILFSLAALASGLFAGPVFAPGTALSVIKTEHFDIIFPERSKPSALLLSSFAEEVYGEVAGKLETDAPARIPVAITPDVGTFNGYFSGTPYPHIVLYDTSLDLGWTSFSENFRQLFLHELTHALSLSVRSPQVAFLSGIFGPWVYPSRFNTPAFMLEGVTVSFESADGETGRANDPLVKERLRQDIFENRFKSPIEASGAYDEYPSGSIYYEYGGLFNAWLQKRYGMEAYARLWKAMGDITLPRSLAAGFDPYESFFYADFLKVYGIPFKEAWAAFRYSLALPGVKEAPEIVLPGAGLRSDAPPMAVSRLAAGGNSLFWIDARASRAVELDTTTMKSRNLFDAPTGSAVCDASADGKRLLVALSAPLPDGRDRLETRIYDIAARSFVEGSAADGLRDARFFRDGQIGIRSELHDTDLVYAGAGGQKVLLRGSDEVMYSSPAVLDGSRVALIVAVRGRRSVAILDVDSGRLSLVRPSDAGASGDGPGLFAYTREISASHGVIYFNHNSDDGFYKLGSIADGRIRLEAENYSGGIFSPVEAGGRVYYAGRFSAGNMICRYPGEASLPGARETGYTLEDFEPGARREAQDARVAEAARDTAVTGYSPLAYANPFNFWVPYVDLENLGKSFRPMAAFLFSDPIDTNQVKLTLGYDSIHPFADSTIAWTNAELPVAINAKLYDNLVYGGKDEPWRQAGIALSGSLNLPLYPTPRALGFGLGGDVFARSAGGGGSPYGWAWEGWGAAASATLAWKGLAQGAERGSSRGVDITNYHDLSLAGLVYKTEAHLRASVESPSLGLDLWAAWAGAPILRLDASSEVFSSDRRPAYFEYKSSDLSGSLLAEGSASWRAVNQEIRAELLGLYFNRMLVDAGFRAAWFAGGAFASAFARVSVELAAPIGMLSLSSRVFCEAFYRLDGSAFADARGIRFGLASEKFGSPF